MREIVHLQAGQCGNQIGAKVKCTNKLLCLRTDCSDWKNAHDALRGDKPAFKEAFISCMQDLKTHLPKLNTLRRDWEWKPLNHCTMGNQTFLLFPLFIIAIIVPSWHIYYS